MIPGETNLIPLEELMTLAGQELGISCWFTISQARIDAFADTTDDHQFIHIDPARTVAETPFKGTIAHGFLTLSMLSAMAYDAMPGVPDTWMSINYGFEKLRFIAPVPSGARIRGRFTLLKVDQRQAGELTLNWQVSVEIENAEKPALAAEWINRKYFGAKPAFPGSY